MRDTILFGDCRETLKEFDEKARMCVTSPPYYGLRNYGDEEYQIGLEQTPEEFIKQLVNVFKEVKNVLTDDGTLWVNVGDSYYNYRPGRGQGLAKQTVSNTKQDLPDVCPRRGNRLEGLKEKDLIGIPWMFAFAMRADGWYLRQDIIWSKPNPMPESVRDRCTKSHEYMFLFSKNQNYYFDVDAIKEPTRRKRSVWNVTKKPYKGAHFAVYPPELIEPCIKAGSEKGDIVLDPFMGSGTTAMVAKSLGRDYIGCELHEDYGNLIQKRVKEYHPVEEVSQETSVNILDIV
jgi:DNA modification methylase